MKNKERDIPYCGCDKEKIKKAKLKFNEEVFLDHHTYIFERHRIWKKKEVLKLPPPWTSNKIFQNYRFTNVRRELDKVSKWMIENIVNGKLSYEDKIYNLFLARLFSKIDTFEYLKLPWKFSEIDMNSEEFIEKVRSLENDEMSFHTSSFMVSGLKGGMRLVKNYLPENFLTYVDGIKRVGELPIKTRVSGHLLPVMHTIAYIKHINLPKIMNETKNQKEVYETLLSFPFLGEFFAYQIFVDFSYIREFPYSENEFTVAGPGCKRGLDLMIEDYDGLTYEEALFWLRDNLIDLWKSKCLEYDLEKLFEDLPEDDRNLNVMMLENSFCELSKYEKVKMNLGKAKNAYNPVNTCKINDFI